MVVIAVNRFCDFKWDNLYRPYNILEPVLRGCTFYGGIDNSKHHIYDHQKFNISSHVAI